MPTPKNRKSDFHQSIGKHCIIEPDTRVGHRYRESSEPTVIGDHSIVRSGTIIYTDVRIGHYFQSGHNAIIRSWVIAGDYFALGNGSVLEGMIEIGTGVRLMSQVYVCSRTRFGNDVFVGPGCTFLNEKLPGRQDPPPVPIGASIEDNVMIGGGCTILPGVRVGAGSFIAAGSVITKDIPPESLVVGNPGEIRPLPDKLRCPNNHKLTRAPLDLWHPHSDLNTLQWPGNETFLSNFINS